MVTGERVPDGLRTIAAVTVTPTRRYSHFTLPSRHNSGMSVFTYADRHTATDCFDSVRIR